MLVKNLRASTCKDCTVATKQTAIGRVEVPAFCPLHAAAPELLAALKAWIGNGKVSCNYNCGECGTCLGRAAIAKTEGR